MFIINLVVVQVIIFSIVILVLKKILYGDTESAVNRLESSIQDASKKKEEMASKVSEMDAEYVKKKEEAANLAGEYKDEAQIEMTTKRDEMMSKARVDAEKIVTDAQGMREKIREEIAEEEKNKMFQKCGELLKLTLNDVVRERINEILIDDFLSEMAKVEASHIPHNIEKIEIISNIVLNDNMKTRIKDAIKMKIPNELPVEETVDESLVGGVMLKFGSLVLDGSIGNKLQEKLNEILA